jgi:hypothetical protein
MVLMIVVVFALIVPSTTTSTITTTQLYSVHREERLVQQVTKYLQGVTPLASWLGCFPYALNSRISSRKRVNVVAHTTIFLCIFTTDL